MRAMQVAERMPPQDAASNRACTMDSIGAVVDSRFGVDSVSFMQVPCFESWVFEGEVATIFE
jgi:hypothetical protein